MKAITIIILLALTELCFSQNSGNTEQLIADIAKCMANIMSGDLKVDDGNYKGAILDYNSAINYDSTDAKNYLKRGYAKHLLGDHRGAIQDYTKAITLNPNYDRAYNNRAASKINLKDYIGAKKDASKAININPNLASAYYNRGVSKIKLGDKNGGCLDLSKGGELGDSKSYDIINKLCN